MVDRLFADAGLAALYDRFCAWERRDDFDFYLPMVMSAGAVLDVGCGTGMLLGGARDAGHPGRLCGLDPAEGMLAVARRRRDVEWVLGVLGTVGWDREFDLAVMTGHAFQVFLTDDELRTSLAAVHAALAEGGRFAFETRNPAARAWERWTPDRPVEATVDGAVVRVCYQVTEVVGDMVSFTHTFTHPDWAAAETSESTLRFLGPAALAGLLADAGFAIERQFGDWAGGPLTATSPEIITIARRG